MQTAITETSGDVVLVQDEGTEIRGAEIRRLWEMRHDRQLVMARAELPRRALNPHLLDRLANWGEQLREARCITPEGGIQMIRREALADLADADPAAARDIAGDGRLTGPNFLREVGNGTLAGTSAGPAH